MDARKKEIEHLDAEISRLEHQITAECIEIGRRLASLPLPQAQNPELLKYLNSVGGLRQSVQAHRGEIDRIRDLTRQIQARGQEIDDNSRRRAALMEERTHRFVELGVGSFQVYKKLTETEREPYRATFEELMRLDSEIERRHDELKALEADEQGKGLFDKLRRNWHKLQLRGDISTLDKTKTSAYEHAGARIADTDFSRFLEGGALQQIFDFTQERKRAAESLSQENDLKVEEIESYRQELKRLGTDGDLEGKVREIERRLEGIQKELDVMYCWTGQVYFEHDLRAEAGDSTLVAKYEIVGGLRESIHKKRQQIHRLKAELELEDLVKKEKALRARRKMVEEDMRVKERQIGVIDIEINMGLRRQEELKRVLAGETAYTDAPPLPPTPDLYPRTDEAREPLER